MGEVYKAEDTRLKRQVALKVLTPALGEHADAKQRLVVEAQAASALDHPNICTIYEIDETAEGRVFLVMAYYEGETLAQRLARGVVAVAEAIEILVQLTRAVAAAHGAGMIHRDIKPANIFLTSRSADDPSRVKLLDFDIAKVQDQTAPACHGSRADRRGLSHARRIREIHSGVSQVAHVAARTDRRSGGDRGRARLLPATPYQYRSTRR